MKIRALNYDDMHVIELYNLFKNIDDQIPLGQDIFATCNEHVDIIDFGDNDVIAQIVLTDNQLTNVNDGFSDNLMEGKITFKHGKPQIKWDKPDYSDYDNPKLYAKIIKTGKNAFQNYINGAYNHFANHYKKVPEIVVDDEDNYVNAHKLV